MIDDIIYRTNSYTGREDPFTHPTIALMYEEDLLSVLTSLKFLIGDEEKGYESKMLKRLLDSATSAQPYEEYRQLSEQSQMKFWDDIMDIVQEQIGPVNYVCWFTTKDRVLDRRNGYGKNLCKENGILRCYAQGKVLVSKRFETLNAFKELPILAQDTITNNQLISRNQLIKLLDAEEQYGGLLATTCLKKNVLNLLKRADKGLLGTSFTPSFEIVERRRQEERDKILLDIL